MGLVGSLHMAEFWSAPSISWLVMRLIPVKHLWNFINQVAHTATPAIAAINELHEGVDTSPAAATTSDYSVGD